MAGGFWVFGKEKQERMSWVRSLKSKINNRQSSIVNALGALTTSRLRRSPYRLDGAKRSQAMLREERFSYSLLLTIDDC
jgi:hypothetical protein